MLFDAEFLLMLVIFLLVQLLLSAFMDDTVGYELGKLPGEYIVEFFEVWLMKFETHSA